MKSVVGVIDIGSTAIRLVVIEVADDGTFKRLDRATRRVNLGRDVFINRSIRSESMSQVIQNLKIFSEMLGNWGIKPEDAYVVATSAVREAMNREIFVDRIKTKTNISVQILDGVEENHLTYIAVNHAVKNFHKSLSKANSIIMEVGGGTTELMVMYKGKMKTALNLKVGTLRLEQQFKRQAHSLFTFEDFILEKLRRGISNLQTDTKLKSIRYFIMVGSDARRAARRIGETRDEHYSVIKRDALFDWIDSIQNMELEELTRELNISYTEVEGFLPSLLIYRIFIQETSAEEIIVPDVSLREGILLRNVVGRSVILSKDFTGQIVASARSLGNRYHVDEENAEQVMKLSLDIYDQIASGHGLANRERLYLEVSAILYSVGYFINQSGYHKHGQYIVSNSEIFGLTEKEIQVVANVVRYHRGNKPFDIHPQFAALSGERRLIVVKLSAVLRVAVALIQDLYIKSPHVELENSVLYISDGQGFSGERDKLRSHSTFFEDVFGYRILYR